MSDLFQGVASSTIKTVSDKLGLIQALLNDIPNEGNGLDYDKWLNLISLLKFELDDDEVAFELFDEFSSKASDNYDPDVTYSKFWESGYEGTGQITIGSLIHLAKEEIPNYDASKYAKFYGSESVTKYEKLNKKLKQSGNRMPKHLLTDIVEPLKLPDVRVDPEVALTILLDPDKTYGTGTNPAQIVLVDPYKGDRMEQYITVNPIEDRREYIDPKNPFKGLRNQANVTDFKYAVLEFDTINLDQQFSIYNTVDLPYEALIFSGNKSIHAWIRIDAPDIETYKRRTKLINKMFQDFGYSKKSPENKGFLDTAVLYDCSSLVRCAGIIRSNTGKEQHVIWAEESSGWEEWYNTVYPKYVIEEDLDSIEVEEEPEIFEPPAKDHNFSRFKKRIDELLQEDYNSEIVEILTATEADQIEDTLNNAVPAFTESIYKKSRRKLEPSEDNIYHLLVDAVLEGGNHYEDDLRKALFKACTLYNKFKEIRAKERKDQLETNVESIKGQISDYVDPDLIVQINEAIKRSTNSDKPEEFEKLVLSIENMFDKLGFRPAVFQENEVHEYASKTGKLLAQEFIRVDPLKHGSIYNYRGEPSFYSVLSNRLDRIDTVRFPSIIAPYLAFVKRTKEGFAVTPLSNDTVTKLIGSHLFSDELRSVQYISDVPVLKELKNGAELITGYDYDMEVLVTGSSEGYEFMGLDEAKKVILELFDDFTFVDKSDLSRAVGALLTPALCYSDLLKGDNRPIWYIDADTAGAGKGTLANILTIPYTDSPALVTQDGTSVGSVDDKVGNCIQEGENLIIIDNLKPTSRMKELSSSFLEGLVTTDKIGFRSAGQRHQTLSTEKVCLYLTTNGMPLSKDLSKRSLYISIRKKEAKYSFKEYSGGIIQWLRTNRPRIMSAIYTIIREYISIGKPENKPDEHHRFLRTVPILNFIVKDILELPDITTNTNKRVMQKSNSFQETVRSIMFILAEKEKLNIKLTNLDLFEILEEANQEHLLGLDKNVELYVDENFNLSNEGKRHIGIKMSDLFRRVLGPAGNKKEETQCTIEEFTLIRSFDSRGKQARYEVIKNGQTED